jgi:exonuclease III
MSKSIDSPKCLSIVEWNINFRNTVDDVPQVTKDALTNMNANSAEVDVIVLLEAHNRYGEVNIDRVEQIKEILSDYKFITDDGMRVENVDGTLHETAGKHRSGVTRMSMGVMVGINKNRFSQISEYSISSITAKGPEIAIAEFLYENRKVAVIGTRMRFKNNNDSNSFEPYRALPYREQVDELFNEIVSYKANNTDVPIILAGDFNIEENLNGDSNWKHFVSRCEKHGLTTPKTDSSTFMTGSTLDYVLCDTSFGCVESIADWSFALRNGYKIVGDFIFRTDAPNPDHAMLRSKITIKE